MNKQMVRPNRIFRRNEPQTFAVRSGKVRTIGFLFVLFTLILLAGWGLWLLSANSCRTLTTSKPTFLPVADSLSATDSLSASQTSPAVSAFELPQTSPQTVPQTSAFALPLTAPDSSRNLSPQAPPESLADVPSTETRLAVPTLTDNSGMTYPREISLAAVSVQADTHQTRTEGAYSVHVLRGNCELHQGRDSFRAGNMVLWVSPLQFDESGEAVHRILLYLEENVEIAFVTSRTTSRVKARTWAGRLSARDLPILNVSAQSSAEPSAKSAGEADALYARASRVMFEPAKLLLTQYSETQPSTAPITAAPSASAASPANGSGELIVATEPLHEAEGTAHPHVLSTQGTILPGDVSAFDPNSPAPGAQRIGFFQRNDVPLEVRFSYDQQTKKSVAIFDKGVTLLIDGAEKALTQLDSLNELKSLQIGTIDISADRLVLWSDSDLSNIRQDRSLDLTKTHIELYLEGNIIFRQGDQEIYADKMYFDVSTRRGLIREAEVFAAIPNVEGLIRLRAEEIRMPEEGLMMASDTFVTTSRIGEPLYRFQMGQIMLRSQQFPRKNRFTGEVERDPQTGEPILDSRKDLIARQTMVKVGNVPVFYLPYFAAPMDSPSQIINKFSIRNDSIFGFQPIIGVDAYRLLGIEKPWTNTSWDLNASYYTKRGPGLGTEFEYDRLGANQEIPLGIFSGPGKGKFQFWGIYDTGDDNLGYERRNLIPEKDFRYQAIGQHKSTFGNDWELRFQLGVISDRNFQEEYFQNSWYTEPDRATQLEIRKSEENRTLSLWADLRTNDFHTQTQRTPQLDFYWLGQPLFGDVLTWSSYSEVGYVHLYPDTAPTDPADRALWHLLDWEKESKGIRSSTRHEISYPFQAGPVKLVPFALGEAAYWGEDLQGEATSRVYGQAGIRASLPMWQYYGWQNRLFNVNGIMHKVEFDVEALAAGSNLDVDELPLYDIPDDRALMDFSHHMSSTLFGRLPIPKKYQLRSYAIRSNLGGWVTSNTELADDLAMIRFGMHHRWQTKRGMPGREKIIDWVTFDTNFNIYPDPDRDNFGSAIGLWDYDLRWYPGDRVMLYSSGLFDFFTDGVRMVDVGAVLDRPGKGSIFTSLHYLTGSIENVVMRIGYNYRMSEKWTSTFVSTFDISGKGNIGEGLSVTRIGESFLFTTGIAYDAPSDNFSIHFALEPRFGKKGNTATLFNIAPPGVDGID